VDLVAEVRGTIGDFGPTAMADRGERSDEVMDR